MMMSAYLDCSRHLEECVVLTGHSGKGGQRRDPQGHVLAPVLAPRAEEIHHPGLLEQLVQRVQPGQLPQAADAAH